MFARMFILVTDPDRIKRLIYQGKNAFEQESVERVMAILSPDFTDSLGNDCQFIRQEIDQFFDSFDSIEISLKIASVRVLKSELGKTSLCSLRVRVFACFEGEKGLIYGGVSPADVLIRLIKNDKGWKTYWVKY